MTELESPSDRERHLRNLQAVYRHHSTRGPVGPAAPSPWKKRLAVLGPVGVVLLFVLGKLKFLLPALKFLKFGTVATMFLSVWAYALLWGWAFAAGFVLLIFVHEMGHAIVLKRLGIHAGAPVFIPFVGAVIAMKGLPRNAWVEALVGIGGPVLGGVGALVCWIVGAATGSLFWYSLASTGFLLNLFNLIPISPLDGGRIVGVIGRGLWIAGYAIGIAVFFATYSPILFLILLLGLFNLGRTLRGPRPGYFDAPAGKRMTMGAAYFGLVVLLALGMYAADRRLEPLRERMVEAGELRFEHVQDLAGARVDPWAADGARAVVLVFLRGDCPIANRYAPEIQRLRAQFEPQGVAFRLVYPGVEATAERIAEHMRQYGHAGPALRDPGLELVRWAHARVTPEVTVMTPDRTIVYAGRIDDQWVAFGQARSEPTQRELHDVLAAIVAGKTVVPSRTEAVGCFLGDAG